MIPLLKEHASGKRHTQSEDEQSIESRCADDRGGNAKEPFIPAKQAKQGYTQYNCRNDITQIRDTNRIDYENSKNRHQADHDRFFRKDNLD